MTDIQSIQSRNIGLLEPVRSEDDFDLKVVGRIPDALAGAYYRNGANLQFDPRGPYFPFLANGMIHAFFFEPNKDGGRAGSPAASHERSHGALKRTAEQQARLQEQQARLHAQQARLHAQQARHQEQLEQQQEQAVKRGQEIDKQNDAIRSLIVVARTCLDSFQEIRDVQRKDREDWVTQMKELRAAQAETGEKLNILVNTVDRIIRRENHP